MGETVRFDLFSRVRSHRYLRCCCTVRTLPHEIRGRALQKVYNIIYCVIIPILPRYAKGACLPDTCDPHPCSGGGGGGRSFVMCAQ